ncbi:hypothetical protein DFA_05655 [Cavenderia fasciculata]|uniref:CN hydrolase domain-containing protein n=1 Tax=Cavenderia fasciculata TaxID=261658 RepID=F4PLW8_CACFS|nr:uncharacterized protein DFA_05655 [Cavenderia fasciculata]EGG23522.1 hypothetical protein DFA_05655 [Cavenderia fasciculata]|eukprot:XP_004361373.1 hypothetical protein DFA_05655 [Cavenderia fasciculata]
MGLVFLTFLFIFTIVVYYNLIYIFADDPNDKLNCQQMRCYVNNTDGSTIENDSPCNYEIPKEKIKLYVTLSSTMLIGIISIIVVALLLGVLQNNNSLVFFDDSKDEYYIGAVLEYSIPRFNYSSNKENAIKYMNSNLDAYEKYLIEAVKYEAQIIVFPEYGIIGSWSELKSRDQMNLFLEIIPDPDTHNSSIIPCDEDIFKDRPILKRLSCMAKKNNIYLVADYGDLQPCDKSIDKDCPNDGRYQFNTVIVFSPIGRLLLKFHKAHTIFEDSMNKPVKYHAKFFDSDFGVRFGTFICFDLMWKQPQTDLIEKHGIQTLLFSTEWVNFQSMTARQMQQSWSALTGLTILASNNGENKLASGSGIYSAGEVIVSHVNPTDRPIDILMISKVPKIPNSKLSKKFSKESKVIYFDRPDLIDKSNFDYSTINFKQTVTPFNIKGKNQVIENSNNGLTLITMKGWQS